MLALLLAPALMTAPPADRSDPAPLRCYVGTYTGSGSEGIYLIELDPATGELGEPTLAAAVENPSFVAFSPDQTRLYAVSEAFGDSRKGTDGITAFAVRPDGTLERLNAQPTAADGANAGACHVSVSPTGAAVFAANYGGGSVASFPVAADGSLGEPASFIQHEGSSVNPKRQSAPHAHSCTVSPDGRFLVVADLGLDQLKVYRIDPDTAALTPHDPPHVDTKPGGGPRHFAFHPNGRLAFVNLELTSEVSAFAWDADAGTLTPLGTLSTLPDGFDGENSTAETLVHPSGQLLYVYVSNRGHDSVAVFGVRGDGWMDLVEIQPTGTKTPRGMGLSPDGRYLLACGQDSGDVASFHVDPDTGALTPTGSKVKVAKAVNVRIVAP